MKHPFKKRDFEILDSIRGIAALYVAIAHCRGTLWMGGSEYSKLFPREGWNIGDYIIFGSSMLTRLAVEFVIVFFVLSGFSIAHSLASDKSPLRFYKRRLIRIYPSYVMALVWAGAIFLITKWIFPEWYNGLYTQFAFLRTIEMNEFFTPSKVAGNLLYMPMHGFVGPFWSLTYEVIFYLLAPFILRNIKIYAAVSTLLFAASFLFPDQIKSMDIPVYIQEFLFTYNIYFAVGVLFYNYFEEVNKAISFLSRNVLLLLLLLTLGATYAVNFYFKIETVYSFMVAAVLGILLMIYFLRHRVEIPWLMKIGQFSYTLYITHFASVYLYLAIFWTISGHRAPYIVNYFVWMPAVLFVVALGWLQYSLIEKKTKKILDLLRKPRDIKATGAAAPVS
jgi:peptidoglycan/LPS O-acetylase OafA/YrhL